MPIKIILNNRQSVREVRIIPVTHNIIIKVSGGAFTNKTEKPLYHGASLVK